MVKIDLPEFSGPLELLLHLIEEQELDITAISLATVAEQYLAFVRQLEENRVEFLIDFLVIGARLLVIKSRSLLPPQSIDTTESLEDDPAAALTRQLERYRQYKIVANWLSERQKVGLRTHVRVAAVARQKPQVNLEGISLSILAEAFLSALTRSKNVESGLEVTVKDHRHTIEGQIKRLRNELTKNRSIQFRQLLSNSITWMEVSVTLLAVLELIKRHEVRVEQEEIFGPIRILRLTG